jgi:hypothetical protein
VAEVTATPVYVTIRKYKSTRFVKKQGTRFKVKCTAHIRMIGITLIPKADERKIDYQIGDFVDLNLVKPCRKEFNLNCGCCETWS